MGKDQVPETIAVLLQSMGLQWLEAHLYLQAEVHLTAEAPLQFILFKKIVHERIEAQSLSLQLKVHALLFQEVMED